MNPTASVPAVPAIRRLRASLAVKIFLSFWLIHAVIFVVLGLIGNFGDGIWDVETARFDGRLAAALLERDGPEACKLGLQSMSLDHHLDLALLRPDGRAACESPTPGIEAVVYELVPRATPDGVALTVNGRRSTAVTVEGPGGQRYTIVTSRVAGGDRSGPIGPSIEFLATAIVVSGIVCFLLARYLAAPLQRMQAATHRLREGDLTARAGRGFERRTDEIGGVVRDFDVMAERIESLLRAQTQLLSDISHELRSPLARLSVALELARRSPANAGTHLARIESEVERLNELIGRLLALARVESRGAGTPAEDLDLDDVLRRVAADAAYEARTQGKQVSLETDGSTVLHGDAVLVASAVENVVRNAIRYTPAGTAVEIRLRRDGGRAAVTIRDHGAGLPETELEKIFLPFHRADASRTRESGGTGLGLSIAQRAVIAQGGTIRAANADGGGLEVAISWPLADR